MSFSEPQNPNQSTEFATLRTQLTEDLTTFLNHDVHISGYIVAWLGRNLPMEQLEELVDELDAMYRRGGRSILGRR